MHEILPLIVVLAAAIFASMNATRKPVERRVPVRAQRAHDRRPDIR